MERYSRNILIEEIGETGQTKLLNSSVLVAGAGGLGSTVIANLASMGVGNIGIIDNDKLELSNLNRQYIHKFGNIGKNKADSAKNWVLEYNPNINAEIYPIRLNESNSEDIISSYDLVLDCFDSYESKFMLNKVCIKKNKTLIHGGVTEFFGQVMTIIPNESACLNCLIPDYDPAAYVIKGVISPAVTTIASLQSMETVKILLGVGIPLTNKLLTFDGLKSEFRKINVAKNKDCNLCS